MANFSPFCAFYGNMKGKMAQGHDFSVLFDIQTRRLILQYPSGADSGTSMQMLSQPLGPSQVPTAADWEAQTVVSGMGKFAGCVSTHASATQQLSWQHYL